MAAIFVQTIWNRTIHQWNSFGPSERVRYLSPICSQQVKVCYLNVSAIHVCHSDPHCKLVLLYDPDIMHFCFFPDLLDEARAERNELQRQLDQERMQTAELGEDLDEERRRVGRNGRQAGNKIRIVTGYYFSLSPLFLSPLPFSSFSPLSLTFSSFSPLSPPFLSPPLSLSLNRGLWVSIYLNLTWSIIVYFDQ